MSEQVNHKQDFDRQEPKARFIAVFAGGMVVVLIAVVLGIQFYFDRSREQQVYIKQMLPESEELQALRAREDTDLYSYRYIDRAKGRVRLPIERAMELLEKEAAEGRLPYSTKPQPLPAVERKSDD